jgi:crotonobetainyl-CoA:carnitine CoA-transferase CaiB-like acyl-CoA transferase
MEMDHATGGSMKMIANPVKLSETPADYRLPPPVLGQHTDQILGSKLGLDAAALAALREKGII